MSAGYPGPLRREPIAIELHNTLYAVKGTVVDGLADEASTRAWLAALAPRLPSPNARVPELVALRRAVRQALQAAVDGSPIPRAALDAINEAAAGAPHSPIAVWRPGAGPVAGVDFHGADDADVAIAAFAADAIDLLTGPRRADLRACVAPGCVLLFIKDHPRREWCCNACGNRARQARHYRRTRGAQA